MAPQKLSASDKQDILALYRATEETTSSLANRYGVSNTTISRILKQSLSGEEYDILVQQKRTGAFRGQAPSLSTELTLPAVEVGFTNSPGVDYAQKDAIEPEISSVAQDNKKSGVPQPRRQGKRLIASVESVAAAEPETESAVEQTASFESTATETQLPLLELSAVMASQNLEVQVQKVEIHPLEEMIEGDLLSAEEDFADLEDDDEDDDLDDLDEDDDDDDDDDDDSDLPAVQVQSKAFIQVLPLSEASIPKTCYLVVDRASELVTRPLRDFAELGQIPTEEIQAKTLPIFDNHRVARRFSRRMQRVVKVPDGRVLQKVGSYLQAKGITRLLIDGQVYSI